VLKHYATIRILLTILIASFTVAPSIAQHTSPIRVLGCHPEAANERYPGYVSATYPMEAPYHWQDAYGFRYVEPPIAGNPTLSIAYMNTSDTTAHTVEFGLVARGRLIAEVRDVGEFSPNTEIKHTFGLKKDAYPADTEDPECVTLRVVFTNGTRWENPHLPKMQQSIYQ
jgi:hypothetical protein